MIRSVLVLSVLLIAQSVTLDRALTLRRSTREFAPAPIRLDDLKQLLWAAQGVTSPDGSRTAPSAGALYPIELYVVAGNVDNLGPAAKYGSRAERYCAIEAGCISQMPVGKGGAP